MNKRAEKPSDLAADPPLDRMPLHNIELRHLRYFIAVADELHFGRAAENLGMAQPPLSQQIARLEELLGYRLFTRKPRVALTEPGRVFLAAARRALSDVAVAVDATRRAGRGEIGTLTVGFAASTMLTKVSDLLGAYRSRHPDVHLELRELSTAAQLDALRAGSIDVGLLREPRVDDTMIAVEVIQESFLAVLPPGHHLASSRTLSLQALQNEPFVLFPRRVAPGLHDQVMALCAHAGFVPHQVQEAKEWLTIVGLVDVGLGVSLVPASFERLQWGHVTYHEVDPGGHTTSISICRRATDPAPVLASFLTLAKEIFETR